MIDLVSFKSKPLTEALTEVLTEALTEPLTEALTDTKVNAVSSNTRVIIMTTLYLLALNTSQMFIFNKSTYSCAFPIKATLLWFALC